MESAHKNINMWSMRVCVCVCMAERETDRQSVSIRDSGPRTQSTTGHLALLGQFSRINVRPQKTAEKTHIILKESEHCVDHKRSSRRNFYEQKATSSMKRSVCFANTVYTAQVKRGLNCDCRFEEKKEWWREHWSCTQTWWPYTHTATVTKESRNTGLKAALDLISAVTPAVSFRLIAAHLGWGSQVESAVWSPCCRRCWGLQQEFCTITTS